ncbi:PPE domain-containing protein [Haloactinomyces albus]|uniref:PPE domain-containing protein n=1 Tax=Haloactinomyces albus TaxID=1352928 RepID=A0AAE3ZFL8_9ACTN|nr:PPE domain-containing protein [Haloactinomyces albus]MDR7302855.1 hypothetical protein [Haloactinomyces albus]
MVLGFGWLFGGDDVDTAHNGFDHAKIYNEWQTGPGVADMSQAAGDWGRQVSDAFDVAHAELEGVLKDSEVAVRGAAGDSMRASAKPLQQATRESIGVATQVGSTVEQQAQASADFKAAFPPPHQVPPSNIGWTDYINPVSYGVKKGVQAKHEQLHDEVEAEARRQYEGYTQASNDRTSGIQRFSPVPTFGGEVNRAEAQPVGAVDPNAGGAGAGGGGSGLQVGGTYRAADDSAAGSGQSPTGSTPGGAAPGSGGAPGSSGPGGAADGGNSAPADPAGSESSWATQPPATGGPAPLPGTGTPGTGSGGGFVGGVVGGGSGAGSGVRGGAGTGVGTGRGGSGPAPGGRSGSGTLGTPGAGTPRATAPTASGAGGVRGGAPVAGARGGQQGGDEDEEHENKYMVPTDEAWQDLGLPRTAPPVIGGDLEPVQPPPRPHEEGDSRGGERSLS